MLTRASAIFEDEMDWESCMDEYLGEGYSTKRSMTRQIKRTLSFKSFGNTSPRTDSADELEIPEDLTLDDIVLESTILQAAPFIRPNNLKAFIPGTSRDFTQRDSTEEDSAENNELYDQQVLNFIQTHPYYLHTMVYRASFDLLIKFLEARPSNLAEIINSVDHRGNTPLLLAVKLAPASNAFIRIIWMLLQNGANPHIKDSLGWSVLDEAVVQRNREVVGVLFDYLHAEKMQKWHKNKHYIIDALKALPDFYVEIKWEFDSSVIPLISKIAPSDTCKLWKCGTSLRLDTTLVGWKNLRSKRRKMSMLFRDSLNPARYNSNHLDIDLFLINHSKKMLVNPLEGPDPEERAAVITDIIRSDPVQGDFSILQYNIEPIYNWRGKHCSIKVDKWKGDKYELNLKTELKYKKIGRHYIPYNEKEYFTGVDGECPKPDWPFTDRIVSTSRESNFAQHIVPRAVEEKTDSQGNKIISRKANVWLCKDFPINLMSFLPVLEIISSANQGFAKLHEFLSSEQLASMIPPSSFPIKLDIPINMSIKGVVTFQNFQLITEQIDKHFEIPPYERVKRKIAQKTLTRPKKRLFFANIVV
jgi:hypothetical protein